FHGGGDARSPVVAFEYAEIRQVVAREEADRDVTWRRLLSSPASRKRLGLCFATAVFSQSAGNLLVSNYLAQILGDAGVRDTRDMTLVNGLVGLWQYVVALAVTAVVDRLKRRTLFLVGSGGVAVTFLAWTVAAQQYLDRDSQAAGRVVLACIFVFQAFYTLAWTNLVVTYPLEVVTYQMRAKAWVFVLLTIQVAAIFGAYVNPIALERIGWKLYIYYCVWVTIIFVVVYFFFVETAGPTLEELTYLFEGQDAKLHMMEASRGLGDPAVRDVEETRLKSM
ncbi:hypothetical protein E4U42_000182, partial [Claviceps africana]